jgi:hypothetical protein
MDASGQGSMMGIGGQVRDQPVPHPLLPFGHMILVAPQNSGKTTIILNFFTNESLLEKFLSYYHKIFFVSIHATEDTQSGYEILMARNHHGRFVFLDFMDGPTWQQKITAAAHSVKRNLVILDDMVTNIALMLIIAAKITLCNQLPDHVDIWVVSQGWDIIPKSIRLNIDFAIFMRKAVATFGSEFIGTSSTKGAIVRYKDAKSFPPSAMLRLMLHCLCNMHDFLYVALCDRLLDADKERRFFVNFTHRIDPRSLTAATGQLHQPRNPILLRDDMRIDAPVADDGEVHLIREYCQQHQVPPPQPALDVSKVNGLYENGACGRAYLRLQAAPAPTPATAPAPASASAPAPPPAATPTLEQQLHSMQLKMEQIVKTNEQLHLQVQEMKTAAANG